MRYILALSSLAARGLGVGFLYLITPGSAVFKNKAYLHPGMVLGEII